MANGCRTFFRVILGILTFLFLIIGLFMLGFGIALKVDPNGLFKVVTQMSEDAGKGMSGTLGDMTNGAAVFMIVLGCITAVISFIGFAGAVSGSKASLIIYAIIMILFLGAEIALIVVVAAYPEKITGNITPITNFTKQDVYFASGNTVLPPYDDYGKSWYFIQNTFQCCGIVSSEEYKNAKVKTANASLQSNYALLLKTKDLTVPISCCKQKNPHPFFNSTDDLTDITKCINGDVEAYNTEGCVKRVFSSTGPIPIAIAGTTLGIEVLLIICAIIIAATSDHSKL